MKKTSRKAQLLNGIKTEWDLSLFYSSITDPQIEKDVRVTEKIYEGFAKKYQKNKDYTTDIQKLLPALKDWQKLMEVSSGKAVRYLHCITDLDSSNTKAASLMNVLLDRLTKASNKTLFFELNLGKIDPKLQKEILGHKDFSVYKYYLEILFRNARHNLSEAEEMILSLKFAPAHRMWVTAQQKFLSSKTIKFKGRELSFAEAIDLRMNLPFKDRTELHKKLMTLCREVSFFAEAELVAIINNKKTSDELRGFTSPEEATILHYQNNKKSVDTLVSTITKHFSSAHKFYKLKARLMGVPYLSGVDVSVSIGKAEKKIKFEEAVDLIRSSFSKADQTFTDIFNSMLALGQIDVYPKKAKRGGAYCGWAHKQPTVVFMNYVESMRSVETLAHEMGHA
ncbi:MAG: M3 family metallopeptidase, partial [Patescibacteria group bacterium]